MRRCPRHPASPFPAPHIHTHCRRHANAFYGPKNLGMRLTQGRDEVRLYQSAITGQRPPTWISACRPRSDTTI